MNRNNFITRKFRFFTLLCISILFTFVSCKNFLNGQGVAENIKQTIEYTKAPACSVLLKCDSWQGTFIAGDSKEFKVGYETEIYFSANKENCLLDYLAAQSATDASKDMSEYIKIEITERDDEKGFYTIKVKILKKAPDIIIKPVCIPFPAVNSYSPKESSEAAYANMPITINFNIPMENASTSSAYSQFNYKNIFLTYKSVDVSSYFDDPEFNSEKTILTIKPKNTFLDFIKSTNEVSIKVNVEFAENINVKVGTKELRLKQDDNTKFEVSYKPALEAQPPVENGFGFFVSNNEYSLEELQGKTKSDISQLNIFNQESIENKGNRSTEEYSKKVLQNRTTGTINIYGRYFDKDSGVNKITITSQHVFDRKANLVQDEAETKEYYVDNAYSDATFVKQDNNVLFNLKYTIPEVSQNLIDNDGAYNFTVTIYDSCGNASQPQTFTAIKDNYMDLSSIKVFNIYNNIETNESTIDERQRKVVECYNNGTYNDKIKTIKFVYGRPIYSVVEGLNYVDFSVKYINKTGQEVIETIEPDSTNKKYYEHTLNVDHVYDLKFTLIAKDNYGSIETIDYYFPPLPTISGKDYLIVPANSKCTGIFFSYLNSEGIMEDGTTLVYTEKLETIHFPNTNVDYRRETVAYLENGMLFSEYSPTTITQKYSADFYFEEDSDLPVPPAIKSVQYGVNGSLKTFTITLDDNTWDNNLDSWDYIWVFYCMCGYPWLAVDIPEMLFPKGVLSNTIESNNIGDYEEREYYAIGIKGNKRSAFSQIKKIITSSEVFASINTQINNNMAPNNVTTLYGSYWGEFSSIPYYRFDNCFALTHSAKYTDTIQVTVNNTYRTVFDSNSFGNSNESIVIHLGDGYFYIPVMDWQYGNNVIDVYIKNKNGACSYSNELPLEKSQIIFDKPDQTNLPVSSINLISKTTTYDIDSQYPSTDVPYEAGSYIYVSYLDCEGWHQWGRFGKRPEYVGSGIVPVAGEIVKDGTAGAYTYSINTDDDYTTDYGEIPQNCFVKVFTSLAFGKKVGTMMFYNGSTPSSGEKTDKLMDKGNYFFVTSDKPVYVTTYVTKCAYSECSDWSVAEWEELHYHYNDSYISFDSNSSDTLGIYTPDTSWLQSGDCYVVIAYYADGHTLMSDVKIK